jgi:hypothetical protein
MEDIQLLIFLIKKVALTFVSSLQEDAVQMASIVNIIIVSHL